jgi:hypothetical protein
LNMPKKRKADSEQVASPETTATPAPAKKRVSATAKSAAATHKSPAKRTAKKPAAPEAVDTAAPAVAEPDYIATVLEVVETTIIDEKPVITTAATPVMIDPVAAREEIARIAYSYWVARDFAPGDPLQDWLRAESEFYARHYATA